LLADLAEFNMRASVERIKDLLKARIFAKRELRNVVNSR